LEEGYTLGLKSEVTSDLKKEVIAFANSEGGNIYIGIKDDGRLIGVENVTKEMERISNMIRDGIKPDLSSYISVELVEKEGFLLIKVAVLRGPRRPYHLSDKGMKPSGVYVRLGVTSAPATEESIREMIKESDGTAFDKSRSLNQDLTFEYANHYFAESNLKYEESNKRTLKLINKEGYYTNAALLLSDQCEHSIKCAVYEGTGKTKFKARQEFFGSILKQMNDAYQYISLNNNLNSTLEGLRRVDYPDYPDYAIREALLNTIVHRDYDYSGSTLVNIFSDRIEFVSIGGLVGGITMTDIMRGVSQSRNTIIANIFYRLELIESYGTGIQRIIESYEDCNEKPTFIPGPTSFVAVLPNRNKTGGVQFDSKLSHEDNVLRMLQEKGEITRRDVEALLSCSQYPAIGALNNLLAQQKIVKVGSARATKYVLAD